MQEDPVNTLKDIVVMDDVTEEPTVTKTTSLEVNNLPTVTAHKVVGMQRQEVHPSKNIQHGLDLWERVREYDARTAAEAAQFDTSLHVLTRSLMCVVHTHPLVGMRTYDLTGWNRQLRRRW
jgi:hypothetical protein